MLRYVTDFTKINKIELKNIKKVSKRLTNLNIKLYLLQLSNLLKFNLLQYFFYFRNNNTEYRYFFIYFNQYYLFLAKITNFNQNNSNLYIHILLLLIKK